MINASGVIYNHCIALHRRYDRVWDKYLNCARLQKHIPNLRKRNLFWQLVGSQAVQDICLFFTQHKKGVRPPGFKKVKKYKSFTLKESGYQFIGANRSQIGQKVYQLWKSREIDKKVKMLTIKGTPLSELFMVVVVDSVRESEIKFDTGKIAGFDFGLTAYSMYIWYNGVST